MKNNAETEIGENDTMLEKFRSQNPSYIIEYIVAFSATLVLFAGGISNAWTSPAVPKLMATDSPIPITLSDSSWLVSFRCIGTLIAALPTAWMMDKFGRKYTILTGAVPLLIGWIMIGVAESVVVLYAARIFIGYTYALIYAITPMYLGEISSDAVRGSIGAMLTIMAKAGILYVYVIGPYVSFRLLTWISLIPVVVFLCTFIWCPESPYFLLGKSRNDDAHKSLAKLRGHKNVHDELMRMTMAVKKSQENRGSFQELLKKGNRRGLIIVLGLEAAQQLCGSQAILAYSHRIFVSIGSNLGPSEASIIMAVIQLLAASVSSYFVDSWGRRPLLLFSTFCVGICNTIIGVYFLLARYTDVSGINWLPMVAIMSFFVFYTVGLAPVPHVIGGEIFPKNIKQYIVGIQILSIGCSAFGVTKLFQVVSDELGSDYTFLGFAAFTFFFCGFIYFTIPETKGKPLDEILDLLNK